MEDVEARSSRASSSAFMAKTFSLSLTLHNVFSYIQAHMFGRKYFDGRRNEENDDSRKCNYLKRCTLYSLCFICARGRAETGLLWFSVVVNIILYNHFVTRIFFQFLLHLMTASGQSANVMH
jgi:hypothetical protein